MREDITDDLLVFDEADDLHDALTFRTNQRVNLIYFNVQTFLEIIIIREDGCRKGKTQVPAAKTVNSADWNNIFCLISRIILLESLLSMIILSP